MKQHSVKLSHSTVQYWVHHPEKKKTVVAIHGFRGTHHGLQKIAEQLSDYRVIVPDLPGFGASEPFVEVPHSLEYYVKFLHEFVQSLNLPEKPDIVGHSFGSIVVGHFVAKYPDDARTLTLINPISAPALEGPRGALTRLAIAYYWLGRKMPQKSAAKWLGTPLIVKIMSNTMAKTKDKKILAYIHDQHRQYFSTFANKQVVAEAFHASVSNDVMRVAHELKIPTLIIAGDLDDIVPLRKQRELHTKIPTSELAIIDGVGHLVHYEKPVEVATEIKKFLSK